MRKFFAIALIATVGIGGMSIRSEAFEMRPHCKGYRTNVNTARCAARVNHIDVEKFIAVGNCESGWQSEPRRYSRHHGPLQYLTSTFDSHMSYFPKYRRWHGLVWNVHHVRSQIMIAARYIRFHGWSPWSCA